MSDAAEKTIERKARQVELPEGRAVMVFWYEGTWYIHFLNGEKKHEVAISDEAASALVSLLCEPKEIHDEINGVVGGSGQ